MSSRWQNDILWSAASNSQTLYSKWITVGHSTLFFSCTRESQVCKPHTAALISSLNSHRSTLKTSHLILVFLNSKYDQTSQYLLTGKRHWRLEPVAVQYDQLKKSAFLFWMLHTKTFIQSEVTILSLIHFFHFFFKHCINRKHFIISWDYITIT